MARTQTVDKARASKKSRTCFTCNQAIEVGQSYRWNQPTRWSMRYNWHTACAAPPASSLESNDKRAAAMAAFENAYANLDDLDLTDPEAVADALTDIVDTATEGVREAAEMWQEAADSIEQGFGHSTYQSEELAEHADVYEQVASTIESIDVEPYDAENDDAEWAVAQVDAVRSALNDAEGDLD